MIAPLRCSPHVPILETARLRLRAHSVADFAALTAMWNDPLVTRYVGNRSFTGEECWTRLLRYMGHWSALGFGYWAVEERETGSFVGEAGFADYHREVDPPVELAPEVGWVLARPFHGKGYATEIARALLEWSDKHFPEQPVRCLIDPEHTASLRVAEKCGFVAVGRVVYKNGPAVLLERTGRPACVD